MSIDSITPEDVRGRSQVDKLAPEDPLLALKKARSIKHPWYRCQSLSTVAEHIEKSQKRSVLVEALEVANEQSEINRIVTVSSWPMRLLAKLEPELAESKIKSLVGLAESEHHTLRRADALFALAWSVSEVDNCLKLVIPSLTKALLSGNGWRIDRLIRHSVELIKKVQPDVLSTLIAHHTDTRKKKQLLLYVEQSQI